MLMLKNLGSALAAVTVLSLGTYSAEAAAKPHVHLASKHNKAELRENRKAAKAFRGLPYAEQKIQCQAAYQAFDDFDHGKFRRR